MCSSDLRNPIYLDTASYGHMGRKPANVKKEFVSLDGKKKSFDLETFTWEKLDMVDRVKETLLKYQKNNRELNIKS